ncbi:MAG: SIMPL domain-containing protein [Anditalea sp.]
MKKTILVTFGLLAFLHLAQAQTLRTIEVEGNSEMMIIPDEALIDITVQKKAMTVAEATKDLNAASKRIADAFQQSDLTYDLTANNYYVNVNRIYQKGTSKDSGYVASQNLKIKIKSIEKELAKAVELINKIGDQSVHVNFDISKEMEKSYKDQLLESALKDALSKAGKISEIMDLKNTTVHKVQYVSEEAINRSFQMRASAMMYDRTTEAREDPIFMPEEQKISDRILVTFVFEP